MKKRLLNQAAFFMIFLKFFELATIPKQSQTI